MIAVIGSSGLLGTRVVQRLSDQGHSVVATSRKPDPSKVPSGVEVRELDVRDVDSIRSALAGATSVVIASHGLNPPGWRNGPKQVDDEGVANIASVLTGSDTHVTYLSLVGASPDHELEFWRAKASGEKHLADSGVPTAVIRSSAFMEFHAVELLANPMAKGKKATIIGRGDSLRNMVSADDVADLVVWAVTERHEGTLQAIGPNNASPNDDVDSIAQTLGSEPKAMRIKPSIANLIAKGPGRLVPNIGRIIAVSLHGDARDDPHEQPIGPPGAPVPSRCLVDVVEANR